MTIELKDLQDSFAEMKETNNILLDAKLKGLGVADLQEKASRIDAKMDASEAKLEQEKNARLALEAKYEELALALERNPKMDAKQAEDLHAKSIELYLCKGEMHLSAEQKSLVTDSDPDGGFILAPSATAKVETFMFESSPMRQYGDVMTISTHDYLLTIDNDECGGEWVGEKQTRSETSTPIFQTKRIVPYELSAEPAASQRMIDDAAVSIEQWLAGKVQSKFSRMENTAFVLGSGVEKPRGFLTYANGVITSSASQGLIEQISSGDASLITADGLIEMEGALKSNYIGNANFFLNRTSVSAVRKLVDGQGNYLWAPGFDGKVANTIMGYSYARFDDMPAEAANALAVAFGDMKEAYQIVDRVGIRVLRDPLTSKGFVKFYTTKRVGGDVKNFEALKIMKVEA